MTLAVPVAADIRTSILRQISNGLIARGVANPNVGFGSDYYVVADSLATELEGVNAAAVTLGEQFMPDTAAGVYLDQWLAVVGLARRGAGISTGLVVYSTTAAGAVPNGSELTDPNTGARFTVTTGGTYSNGDFIPVSSVATGLGTNLAGGAVLKWTTPPVYSAATAAFDANGATGGVNAEDDETARARLLQRLSNPPGGGNASQIAGVAEDATVAVQKAFVYPACNGPATEHVAVVGYASASATRHRDVNAAGVLLVSSAVSAEFPEFAETVITTVANQNADLAIKLQLPDATTATAGQSTGWVDSVPWPSISGTTQQYTRVTAVTNSTSFRVESAVAASAGVSIAWIDRTNFTYKTAKVLTVSTVVAPSLPAMGTFNITIDTPFSGVAVNDFVFPMAVNGQMYVTAILNTFAAMGPGEKTNVAGVLTGGRAYRRPRYFESYPYTIGGNFLKALTNAGDEVLDAQWAYQNGGTVTPTLPTVISNAPNVFVPRYLGIYKL